jgi:hypothetical protein
VQTAKPQIWPCRFIRWFSSPPIRPRQAGPGKLRHATRSSAGFLNPQPRVGMASRVAWHKLSDQAFGLIPLLIVPIRSESMCDSSEIHWRVLSFVMEATVRLRDAAGDIRQGVRQEVREGSPYEYSAMSKG